MTMKEDRGSLCFTAFLATMEITPKERQNRSVKSLVYFRRLKSWKKKKKVKVKVKASSTMIKAAIQAWSEDRSLCLRKGNSIFTAGELAVPTKATHEQRKWNHLHTESAFR